MFEDQVIHAPVLDDQRKPIEVLDPRLELAAIEQMHRHGQLLAAGVIQEHILDVRGAGLGFR